MKQCIKGAFGESKDQSKRQFSLTMTVFSKVSYWHKNVNPEFLHFGKNSLFSFNKTNKILTLTNLNYFHGNDFKEDACN